MVGDILESQINDALKALGFPVSEYTVEHPADLSYGDYSTNVALILAKEARKSPQEVAGEIIQYIEQNKPEAIESVEIAGPGFINFHLSRSFFSKSISDIITAGDKWGSNNILRDKKVMVEYTDPNPFKEVHIGHLMSNAIGESISRIIEFSGAQTYRANYQGDVGLHVAKAIYGMQELGGDVFSAEEIGKAYALGAKAYIENEEAKKTIDGINKKVYEQSDAGINKLYDMGRKVSLEAFEEMYKKLGTHFDKYYFERDASSVGIKFIEEHSEIFEKSNGAIIFRGEKYGLHTRVFLTSQGLPTYEAKDLGLAWQKFQDYPLDISVTVTAEEQKEYFKVMRAALAQIYPELEKKMVHITHGMMRLPSGKMSSRTGDVITARDLIDDTEASVRERIKDRNIENVDDVVGQIAIGAIKYSVLKQSTGKNITFDKNKAISFEGDSGPYLQYAHTRARSLLSKGEKEGVSCSTEQVPEKVTDIERLVYRLPEVVLRAQAEYEPHYIATYLTEVASAFNSWYAGGKVLDGTQEASYKLAITQSAAITLKNGLWLLGIRAPEQM